MAEPYRRLCQLNDIPDNDAKGFELDGRPLVAARKGERVYVYDNSCPHRGIRLEWMPDQFMDTEGVFIQCATHGALFNVDDGMCIAGPCSGTPLTGWETEIADGEVKVRPFE